MKRQQLLSDYLRKKTRSEISNEDSCEHEHQTPKDDEISISKTAQIREEDSAAASQLEVHEDPGEHLSDLTPRDGEISTEDREDALPDCWNMKQVEEFQKKYDGLTVRNKKLGCDHCARFDSINMKGIHVSKEWKGSSVEASGKNKVVQQASLRKKMNEHFSSKAHSLCEAQLKGFTDDVITKCIDKVNQTYISSTCKVFNTVYSLAKRNRPFSDIEDEIELQVKNGSHMGVGLKSRKTAVKIVDHIAREIKKHIFTQIIEKKLKLCVIIDEDSTISNKPVIIIFLKIEDSHLSPIIFLDLIELEALDADTIHKNLLKCLCDVGFDIDYLRNNLVAFCSDGASAMLGCKSGVSTRFQKDFPGIIIWHCLNHRLHLVLDDSIIQVKQVNHFKIFIDKIYTIFHQSNKNQMELFKISEELELEIKKIGTVLGPRWAACSLRSTLAVWRAYPALYKYFSAHKDYSGMASRLRNRFFIDDLALMIDILQEISLLSNTLQNRNVNFVRAEKLIKRTIMAFEILKESLGNFEKKVAPTINSDAFKDIDFVENQKYVNLPRKKLLEAIISNMKTRLMYRDHLKSRNKAENSDITIQEIVNTLDPDSWNIEEVVVPWKAAEEKLCEFNNLFHYEININDFRDYVENVLRNQHNHEIPSTVQRAKNIINTVAVSSAEVERGFSTLNNIYSDKRSRLKVQDVANLMTVNMIGLPLDSWDAAPSVLTWMRKIHTADDNRVKHGKNKLYDDNQLAIWNYFKEYVTNEQNFSFNFSENIT